MKRTFILLMSLFAMMAVGAGLRAQEITIMLNPGWNWISYPNAATMGIGEALGDFVPMEGDMIKSQNSFASYYSGSWAGGLTQFTPGWGYMYYSARTEGVEFAFAYAGASNVVVTTSEPTNINGTSVTVGGIVTIGEGNHVFARGVCWSTEPNPDIDGNHTTDAMVTGSLSDTLTELLPGTTYYVRAYVVTDYGLAYGEELSFTTDNSGGGGGDHDYVDLGLPSGTLWATCNVGANAPEEYGDYFAWGETQPKDYYDWSSYQYCISDKQTLTKYCSNSNYGYNGFTDDLTILLPEDDASTANWGSDWRTPTSAEFNELYSYTISTWTTQNGINGWLFTASNGNSLFLPAAGYRAGSSLYYAGSHGSYWSSSLITRSPCDAYFFHFTASGGMPVVTDEYRSTGISVRPVRSTPQNNVPTGAIDGKFTINENGGQVYFSQGNLQYQASTNTWKFAENQYDYVGEDNNNISSTYSGWIDLFGWGTSGYDHGAVCYQPWSTSQNQSDYYAYDSYLYNLFDQTGEADWGYNPISNGGNQTNQWRSLTNEEWGYLFNTRETTSGIRYAKATVNDVNGMILLPDNWNSAYYTLSSTNSINASFSSNVITASQWSTLEQAGVVFLPAAGYRYGTSVYEVDAFGIYWSASYHGIYYAYRMGFNDNNFYPQSGSNRYGGFSVRVVCPAE